MIILGIDPGLGTTGWGVIAAYGNRLSHIANGQIKTDSKAPVPERLVALDAERAVLTLQTQRMRATVALVKALGGEG